MRFGDPGVADARQFRLVASTVRAIDLRYSGAAGGRAEETRAAADGVGEIYLRKKCKFGSVVSDLETAMPPTPAQWVNVERVRVNDSFTRVW